MLRAVEIKPDVYWVGVVDWNSREFDGHPIDRGTTYNAYLIIDEHVTLIDCCKAGFATELLERISTVIDPRKIEYVISNHGEMDHSGALPRIMEYAPAAQVVTTNPQGLSCLKACYGDNYNYYPIKTGDTLCIGKRTLQFIATPMVHWPDNMVTYSDYDKVLFSNDSFGQHFTSSKRFDDEVNLAVAFEEAKKYYANIVMPYSKQVAKALKALDQVGFDVIAPSHGIIWRSYVSEIVSNYHDWCQLKPQEKAVVVYDTMYHSTEKIAMQIADGFMEAGIPVHLYNLADSNISNIMNKVMDARYVAIGSPTLNKNMMPNVAGFLCYMKGLVADKGRVGIPFGSYGWITTAQDQIASVLQGCGYELPLGTLSSQWVPESEYLEDVNESIKNLVVQNKQ